MLGIIVSLWKMMLVVLNGDGPTSCAVPPAPISKNVCKWADLPKNNLEQKSESSDWWGVIFCQRSYAKDSPHLKWAQRLLQWMARWTFGEFWGWWHPPNHQPQRTWHLALGMPSWNRGTREGVLLFLQSGPYPDKFPQIFYTTVAVMPQN